MSNCTHQKIMEALDKCNYVLENCEGGFIDLHSINYCLLDNNVYISLPIFIIIWIVSFYLLSDTANKYLSSALTTLADKLNISQNLAGVTFLAFGNGAPDIISSFVASDNDQAGIDFSVGALVGSGVFITCFVVSSVVYYAKYVQVKKDMFIRDLIIYILTLILVLVFSIDGKISIYETICFFVVYLIYITLAFIQDRKQQSNQEQGETERIEDEGDNEFYLINENGRISNEIDLKNTESKKDIEESMITVDQANETDNENIAKQIVEGKSENNDLEPEKKADKEIPKTAVYKTFFKKKTILDEEHFYQNNNNQNNPATETLINNIKRGIRFKRKSVLEFQLDNIKYKFKKLFFTLDYNKKNLAEKIFYFVIELPFNVLRDLTIPPCEKEQWKQVFFIIMPMSITIFVIISFKQWNFILEHYYISLAMLALIILLMVLFYFTTYRTRPPKNIILLCLASFIMSILWIYFIAKVLLDILNIVGDLLNIPSVFLGMTLLAIGNSAPDLSLNCALAKSGFGEMGISGSIAGPMFNLLIGLGSSVFMQTLKSPDYAVDFDLFSSKCLIILVSIIFLGVNLIRLLIQGYILNFKLSTSVSYIGYVIYLIFFVFISYESFVQGNV